MFVFRKTAPHAAIDAVAEAGEERCGRGSRRGVESREDELGRGEFRDVGFEGGFPGGGGCAEVGGCGGHCVEEAVETAVGSYGC